jgi:hypothetical protein
VVTSTEYGEVGVVQSRLNRSGLGIVNFCRRTLMSQPEQYIRTTQIAGGKKCEYIFRTRIYKASAQPVLPPSITYGSCTPARRRHSVRAIRIALPGDCPTCVFPEILVIKLRSSGQLQGPEPQRGSIRIHIRVQLNRLGRIPCSQICDGTDNIHVLPR